MKVVTIAFAAIGMAMVACGGGGFDKEECEGVEKSINQLIEDCTGAAGTATLSCDTLAENEEKWAASGVTVTCEYDEYYKAWKDYYTCDKENNTLNEGDTKPAGPCGD